MDHWREVVLCLQAARLLLSRVTSSEQLRENISAGLNWMENEPKEGPDLLPFFQVPATLLPQIRHMRLQCNCSTLQL